MNLDQRKLALQVVSGLANYPAQLKHQIGNDLENRLAAIEKGVQQGGIVISVADLQEVAGEELWASIVAGKESVEAFVNG
jgi:hypothetical protein